MLAYYKTIDITNEEIFYSIIKFKGKIICFRRRYLDLKKRIIDTLLINEKLNIISNCNNEYRGEDPRSFIHKNKLYVVDNYYNDNHLIDIEKNLYLKLNIDGKNLTFISHKNKLYIIYSMKPFIMYEIFLIDGSVNKIIEDNNEINNEYRGGTPGYIKSENNYYGFGHRTYYNNNNTILHDIFMWELDFNNYPKIKIIDIEKPTISKNICDPISIIEIDGVKYLITAETDKPWIIEEKKVEQEYITNAYKILI
jgi:hypothetical protein